MKTLLFILLVLGTVYLHSKTWGPLPTTDEEWQFFWVMWAVMYGPAICSIVLGAWLIGGLRRIFSAADRDVRDEDDEDDEDEDEEEDEDENLQPDITISSGKKFTPIREAASQEEEGKMTFGSAIESCLGKYASFKGRASRSEYWKFFLFSILCLIAAAILDNESGTPITYNGRGEYAAGGFYIFVTVIFLLLPNISVTVRRLHDRNRSGWWFWIQLIPLLGSIILLVMMFLKGTEGENKFGPDPLSVDSAAEESSAQASAPTPAPDAKESSAEASARSPAPTATLDVTEQLAKLGKLHAVGILTDDEFKKMKTKLIQA